MTTLIVVACTGWVLWFGPTFTMRYDSGGIHGSTEAYSIGDNQWTHFELHPSKESCLARLSALREQEETAERRAEKELTSDHPGFFAGVWQVRSTKCLPRDMPRDTILVER